MKNSQQLKKALRLLRFRFSKNAEFDFYEALCLSLGGGKP